MATRKPSPRDATLRPEQEARALVGYRAAISLWAHEGSSNAARFNVMLIANAILLVMLTAMLGNSGSSPVPSLVLSVVGIVLSGLWFLQTRRGAEQQGYYMASAREIEETALGEGIQTLARGADFADGDDVSITLDGEAQKMQMSALAGVFTAEFSGLVVVGLFGAAYILLAILTVLQMFLGVFYY